jgi:hypothetical protein
MNLDEGQERARRIEDAVCASRAVIGFASAFQIHNVDVSSRERTGMHPHRDLAHEVGEVQIAWRTVFSFLFVVVR